MPTSTRSCAACSGCVPTKSLPRRRPTSRSMASMRRWPNGGSSKATPIGCISWSVPPEDKKPDARRYAKLGDKGTIFLLSDKLSAKATAEYQVRQIWEPFRVGQVEELTISGPEKSYTLMRKDDMWTVVGMPGRQGARAGARRHAWCACLCSCHGVCRRRQAGPQGVRAREAELEDRSEGRQGQANSGLANNPARCTTTRWCPDRASCSRSTRLTASSSPGRLRNWWSRKRKSEFR